MNSLRLKKVLAAISAQEQESRLHIQNAVSSPIYRKAQDFQRIIKSLLNLEASKAAQLLNQIYTDPNTKNQTTLVKLILESTCADAAMCDALVRLGADTSVRLTNKLGEEKTLSEWVDGIRLFSVKKAVTELEHAFSRFANV